MKTALYIRVSTDRQYEEGYSIEAQIDKLKKWCELKDISDYEFYIDGGWSGSNINRPEIKRLVNDIINKKINNVVVYRLDRLSRSQKDTIFLLEDVFLPNEVNFISLNENFDTTTPYGKAMIGILSVFAQLERENIRERTRMGMYERVKKGLWMGGGTAPFGYDYDRNKNILVPNEHAQDVRDIFDLYLQGYSTTQLATMFDVCGDRQISQILERPTYLGKIKYKGELIDGLHEPIITQEVFDKVQKMKDIRSSKNIVHSEYLFTGLIYCGKCGAKMRYQKWGTNQNGETFAKIYCYSQQKSKQNLVKDPNCDNTKIFADEFDRIVLEDIFNLSDEITALNIQGQSNSVSSINILQDKAEKLTAKIKKLYNLYATSEDELLLETIQENQEELSSILDLLANEKASQRAIDEINENNIIIKNLREKWDTLTIKEKRRAINICVEKIVVTDGEIDIVYNI